MNKFVAANRKYRVLYSVTRTEFYEIQATSPEEAAQRAFRDGTLVDVGETTDVTDCDIEDITLAAHQYDKELSAITNPRRNGTRNTPKARSTRSRRLPS